MLQNYHFLLYIANKPLYFVIYKQQREQKGAFTRKSILCHCVIYIKQRYTV